MFLCVWIYQLCLLLVQGKLSSMWEVRQLLCTNCCVIWKQAIVHEKRNFCITLTLSSCPTFWNKYMKKQRYWTMMFQLYYTVPVQKFENKAFYMVCCLTFFPFLCTRAQSHRIEFWGQDHRSDWSNILQVTLCVWTVHKSRCPKMNAFWSSH